MTVSGSFHPVLLFDGVCNLCRASVLFVIKRDRRGIFRFASQQTRIGQQLIEKHHIEMPSLSSVILIDEGGAHYKSAAVLRTLKYLQFPWPLLYVFIIVPKFIRDAVYDFIGKRRYQWFGQMKECWVPDEKLRARFLDQD